MLKIQPKKIVQLKQQQSENKPLHIKSLKIKPFNKPNIVNIVKLKEKPINLAETIGIDESNDEVDSANGPIVCLDDFPDFSKMVRKQGVAG